MTKRLLAAALSAGLLLNPPASLLAEPADDNAGLASLFFDGAATVQAATRAPKPLSEVAENVTIITAEEIERMNAHNVDEVLNRASGLFVAFSGQEFNGIANSYIHGSEMEHVLILVDGVRWNDAAIGYPKTYNVPVEIISRIEIIKGPAASTWGSSLGGVINIITKDAGNSEQPGGTLTASHGEKNSRELSATAAGQHGVLGYFLAASSQNSDGLLDDRFWERDSLYGKLRVGLPKNATLTLTSGYNEPDFLPFVAPEWGVMVEAHDRNFWATASLDAPLSEAVSISVSAFRKKETFIRPYYTLPDEAFWFENRDDMWTNGLSALLHAGLGRHKLVFGSEYDRSEVDFDGTINHDETWALFANDTITLGAFTLIPGLRYDRFALTEDDALSPSLGATWRWSDVTLLRAAIATGFRRPYISDGVSNPDLTPEEITSYQLGLESSACPLLRLKATLFTSRTKDLWYYDSDDDWITRNGGDMDSYGYELEIASEPWRHLSGRASFTSAYNDYDRDVARTSGEQYTTKLTLLYDNPALVTAELFGIHTWWSENHVFLDGDYDTMVWDLSLNRRFRLSEKTAVTLFATAHNLFDGRYYSNPFYENPHRWVEAGLRFHF